MDLLNGLRTSLVLIVILTAALVGCSDERETALEPLGGGATAASSDAAYSVPTPTAAYGQDDPVEAYRGYLQAAVVATGTPDPRHPLLEQYAMGDARTYWQELIEELVGQNRVLLGPLRSDPKIESKPSDTEVSVIDCVDDSAVRPHDRGTGNVIADAPVETGPLLLRVTLTRTDTGWKASTLESLGRDEPLCVRG